MTDLSLSDPTRTSNTFSTKAETLAFLKQCVRTAHILPLFYFNLDEWRRNAQDVLEKFLQHSWAQQSVVVRSSTLTEDQQHSSCAGSFHSMLDVVGEKALFNAIETVIQSYPDDQQNHQILLQPYLNNVKVSGVAFSCDPNTKSHYIVINYDDLTGSTQKITAGDAAESKCFIWHRRSQQIPAGFLGDVITLIKELEHIFQSAFIDVEFAITHANELFLFQARPLVIKESLPFDMAKHETFLKRIASKISQANKRHPYLYGTRTVYGIMPDWNPAEIIGIRPKPLALSLYRTLITDSVWAYQRDNYGYNNLRSFPLLIDFEGLPYIDVRISFNSFLPKNLPADLAERLVNYYIHRLLSSPTLHDKVEFEIVFSCYTVDLKTRLQALTDYGFSSDEQTIIAEALIQLTNGVINHQDGLWRKDLEKINELKRRQTLLFNSDLDPITKMYWIIEDCKRYGTLPFAGLARAGFIAVQLLKSFVSAGIIDETTYMNFFLSINTISSDIHRDLCQLSKETFLAQYGHLRPGTYDILSPRYDEAPDLYFDWSQAYTHTKTEHSPFSLGIEQLRKIQAHIEQDGLHSNVLDLLEFIKIAIESREYAKFVFSRSVSEFLKILTHYAHELNFSREDCSYINVETIQLLYKTSMDPKELLLNSIKLGQESFTIAKSINLPPLLCSEEDAWFFHFPETEPNFITQQTCTGKVVALDKHVGLLKNSILFIPSADPGFDWIFSHEIAGFITQFGGVNSHMAIRAGELGIPAVIGVGETRYQLWCKAKKLTIDAANKQVLIL